MLITDDFLQRLDKDLDELTRPKEVGNENQSVPWLGGCINFVFFFFALSTRSKCALVIILSTLSCKIKCKIFCKILTSAGLGPCHCVLSCQAFEQESGQR